MESSVAVSQRGAFQNYNFVKFLGLWLGAYALTSIMLAPFHIGRALFMGVRAESLMQGMRLNPASSAMVLHLLEFFATMIAFFIASYFFRFSKWRLALTAMFVECLHTFSLALTYGLTPAQLLDPMNAVRLESMLARLVFPMAGLIIGLGIAKLLEPSSSQRHDAMPSGWGIVPRLPNSKRWLLIVFVAFCGITLCIAGGALAANSLPKMLVAFIRNGPVSDGVSALILGSLEIVFAIGIAVFICRMNITWFEEATAKLIGCAVGLAFLGFAVSDITMGVFLWIRGSNLMVQNLVNSPLTNHIFNAPAMIDAGLAIVVVMMFIWLRRSSTQNDQTFSNPLLEVKEAQETQERSAHGG